MRIFGWAKKDKKIREKNISKSDVTPDTLDASFNRRAEEIESLRKYDRGEKEITPSNLGDLSQHV